MTKILMIEDDVAMAEMYKKVFNFAGFDFDIGIDGEDGIKKASMDQYAVILLDIMMPRMDGIKVLEQLKRQESTKKVPVLILTNLDNDVISTEAMGKGAAGYVIKSEVSNDALIQRVKQLVASGQ